MAEDQLHVGQRGGGWLVDEHRLAAGHRAKLFQVHTAVDAFQQNGVRLFGELFDGIDDRDAALSKLVDETDESIAAGGDVRAAARKRRGHLHLDQRAGGVGVVDQISERDDMRRIAADDAHAKHGLLTAGRIRGRQRKRETTEQKHGKSRHRQTPKKRQGWHAFGR